MEKAQERGQNQLVAAGPAAASGLTLGITWLLTVLALIYLFASLMPLPPNDLWWHMAAGRVIAATGQIPATNIWAYTLPADAPYYFQSWLGEWLLYQLWRIGDVPLLVFARNAMVLGSYGLLAWHGWRQSASGRATALALVVGVVLGFTNWTLRTQSFCWLLFAATLVLTGEYRAGRVGWRWLLLLPPLLALWVNLHGSFVAGLVLLAIVALGEGLRVLLRRPGALSLGRWCLLALASAAALLATLLNPRGSAVFPYLGTMLENPALQRYFIEWQPPTTAANDFVGRCFFAALLGSAALLARSPRRIGLTDLLLFCAFAWLALGGVRYVLWFGMLLVPLLAPHVAAFGRTSRAERPSRTLARAVGLILATLLVALLPWFQPAAYLGPGFAKGLATDGRYAALLGNTNPIGATEWLRRNPLPGRFFTDMSYTSYTIWALPEKQVFADLRVELFPLAVWDEYFAISNAEDGGATRDRWGITHMLLNREYQPVLIAQLAGDTAWREAYSDRDAVIFVRRDLRDLPQGTQ